MNARRLLSTEEWSALAACSAGLAPRRPARWRRVAARVLAAWAQRLAAG